MITRRSFIASSAAFAAAGCASFGDNGGAANAPRFEFGPDGKFTFLHLTDLHLNPNGRRLHPRVERVLRAAFAKHAPTTSTDRTETSTRTGSSRRRSIR